MSPLNLSYSVVYCNTNICILVMLLKQIEIRICVPFKQLLDWHSTISCGSLQHIFVIYSTVMHCNTVNRNMSKLIYNCLRNGHDKCLWKFTQCCFAWFWKCTQCAALPGFEKMHCKANTFNVWWLLWKTCFNIQKLSAINNTTE